MTICILFLEDSDSEIRSIKKALDECREDCGINIEATIVSTLNDARKHLQDRRTHIDVAVLDQKVLDGDDAGKVLADLLSEEQIRTPIIINSAFSFVSDNPLVIKVIQRASMRYSEIIAYIVDFVNTGITRVLGEKGILNSSLKQIFEKSILPLRNSLHADESWTLQDRERAVLRLVVNHLMMQIDSDDKPWLYAETVLHPVGPQLKHGSLIKERGTSEICIVMSPSCDLASHGGSIKTDYISIASIELFSKLSRRIDDLKKKGNQSLIERAKSNNCALYHHFLPPLHGIFEGGLINFRRIRSVKVKELSQNFDVPFAQVSPQLMKDVQSRFASYFGRQGQPVLLHHD